MNRHDAIKVAAMIRCELEERHADDRRRIAVALAMVAERIETYRNRGVPDAHAIALAEREILGALPRR